MSRFKRGDCGKDGRAGAPDGSGQQASPRSLPRLHTTMSGYSLPLSYPLGPILICILTTGHAVLTSRHEAAVRPAFIRNVP
ncbi:hypothetical protein OBBRIDRAFT_494254 [Obba rivulosa]|uniref:Uncharacterized protein n=1 Tax=Obba rivulosa TaxID=1052685 RepID=A0A8E2B0W0_9APHY|nr:hypothetical protein OBBRIDRAFT_494254 [Obba rivulosa]